jgi:3-methyladenine DNA glycosylase AlkD
MPDHRPAHAADAIRCLRAHGNPTRAAFARRYFKTGPGEYAEGDRFLGLRAKDVHALARAFQALPLREVNALLRSPWHEARLLALLVLVRQYPKATSRTREAIFRLYLRNTAHINNWDLVDCSAAPIVGAHLQDGGRQRLRRLARSPLLWERRIAVIATSWFIRQDDFDDTLVIAQVLLNDTHDLIHKAVGWMLREVGKRDRRVEEAFLREHAVHMPRTMLRYAIERFPERLRQRYLRAGR